MAKINLLPWRDELREKRKKEFIAICIGAALIGVLLVVGAWFYYNYKLEDQEQANQLIISTNQNLDVQLKSLEGLQEQRNAIVERMKLIQGLQSQRPVPANLYITKFSRIGDKFTIEGKAESPNAVAEFLRNLEASAWYRNAFMDSFVAVEDNKNKAPSSIVPRVEDSYGSFVVTADLDEIAMPTDAANEAAGSMAVAANDANAAASSTAGAAQ